MKTLSKLMTAFMASSLLFGCSSSGSTEMPTIGVAQLVSHTSLNTIRDAFTDQMEELGYEDGKNVSYDYADASGQINNLNSIISQYQDENAAVVVAIATPTAQAAANISEEIPVVFSAVSDPVGAGLVESLEKPGGNITGTSDEVQVDQILDLALQLVPEAKTVGFLYNASEANSVSNLESAKEKLDYLDSIYNTVIIKDVINRRKVNDIMMLESICRFLFDSIGSNISTKKISDTLASNGRKNSVHTVEEYVNSLLESYILYKVNRFDIKGKQLLKTQEKYYLSDLGLRTYLLGRNNNKDLGHILENIIFLELKRKGYRVYIGKNDDAEVDFVVETEDEYIYIQVALSVREEQTLQRELKSLASIANHYKKYLITLDYDTNNYNGIKQISAIDFLLGKIEL